MTPSPPQPEFELRVGDAEPLGDVLDMLAALLVDELEREQKQLEREETAA